MTDAYSAGVSEMTTKVSERINAEKARTNFSDIISRVKFAKEHLIITRSGKDVAAIIPASELALFHKILEALQLNSDIAAAAEALKCESDTVSWNDLKAELGL